MDVWSRGAAGDGQTTDVWSRATGIGGHGKSDTAPPKRCNLEKGHAGGRDRPPGLLAGHALPEFCLGVVVLGAELSHLSQPVGVVVSRGSLKRV